MFWYTTRVSSSSIWIVFVLQWFHFRIFSTQSFIRYINQWWISRNTLFLLSFKGLFFVSIALSNLYLRRTITCKGQKIKTYNARCLKKSNSWHLFKHTFPVGRVSKYWNRYFDYVEYPEHCRTVYGGKRDYGNFCQKVTQQLVNVSYSTDMPQLVFVTESKYFIQR